MNIRKCQIPDLLLVQPDQFADERGSLEICNFKELSEYGVCTNFVQENLSFSRRNVLRGLHYQLVHPQGKLVQIIRGEVFDVAVDLRRNSATFGHWHGQILSGENRTMLWIPEGFAHGFYTLSESSELIYRCTAPYFPEQERCIIYNDPDLAIAWPLISVSPPVLSPKDQLGSFFKEAAVYL